MARFPRTEPEVAALAQAMVSGLTANAAMYPAPPVLPAALTTLVSAYMTAKNAAIAALGFASCWAFAGMTIVGVGDNCV